MTPGRRKIKRPVGHTAHSVQRLLNGTVWDTDDVSEEQPAGIEA